MNLAGLRPGESVLDVGCGTGGMTIPAKKKVGQSGKAAGIDPSLDMIATARRKAARAGMDIDFRVGVVESLPFPDETFDAVTSSLMMHHLPRHLQVKGLAEIRRVLKPGGRLLIADMTSPSRSRPKRFFYLLAHHEHTVQNNIGDLFRLIKDAGFAEAEQLSAHFLTIAFVRAKKAS